jgi:hypothetical protein
MIEVGHCRNDIGQYDGPSVMLAYRTLILQGDIPLDQGCIATSQLTVSRRKVTHEKLSLSFGEYRGYAASNNLDTIFKSV